MEKMITVPATKYKITCEHCGREIVDVSEAKVSFLLDQHKKTNKLCIRIREEK